MGGPKGSTGRQLALPATAVARVVANSPVYPLRAPAPLLNHIGALLGRTSGFDGVFSAYQYSADVIAWILMRHAVSKGNKKVHRVAEGILRLGQLIMDARIMYRLLDIFPMISWMQSFYAPGRAVADAQLDKIQYLQAWSMLLYCPLENLWYLSYKKVIDLSKNTETQLSLWSCRFWATYVVLQLVHIYRQRQLLQAEKVAFRAAQSVKSADEKKASAPAKEAQWKRQERAMRTDLLSQLGWLPLTAHWSLETGLFPGIVASSFGVLASTQGLVAKWRAAAPS